MEGLLKLAGLLSSGRGVRGIWMIARLIDKLFGGEPVVLLSSRGGLLCNKV